MSRCLWLDGLMMVMMLLAFLCCLFLPLKCAFSDVSQHTILSDTSEHLRIHFFANSDSPYDQLIKQMVRNEVMSAIGVPLTEAYAIKPENALYLLKANCERIRRIAQQKAECAGYHGPISVKVGYMDLPARRQGSVYSPSGKYMALIITIGKGEGSNWWGLLYPDLITRLAKLKRSNEKPVTWETKRIFFNWFMPHH